MLEICEKAYARAGLIGNPSDGYHGKTIALSVKNFWAEVRLTESPEIEIMPNVRDEATYRSVQALHRDVNDHGYYGGVRLIKATIKVFVDHCQSENIKLHTRNFRLTYSSTIPQQVGMAGSSAIIVATLRALMSFYSVSIELQLQPSLVFSVEKDELGIAGGLQDRVIQVYEGLVAMDFSLDATHLINGYECGRYESIDADCLPPLYLAYRPATSEPTEVFHNDLRARYDAGDTVVVDAMLEFTRLTNNAHTALLTRDESSLFDLINANFDLRHSMCELNSAHVEMISVARSIGVSAKYAGSGGAIIGSYHDQAQFERLESAMKAIGCELVQPII